MANASSMDIYQLKITLKYSKPPIWRRIQISKDSTFLELHHAIQSTMGWSNTQPHKFKAPPRFFEGDKEFEIGTIYKDGNLVEYERQFGIVKFDETKHKLCDYFEEPKEKIGYIYDFGDCWEHIIVLEDILSSVAGKVYPVCITGRRASPPEHCTQEEEETHKYEWEIKGFDPRSVKFLKFEENTLDDSSSLDIFQFKISLKRFQPPIWRRIQISKNSTFIDLHYAIQATMDWSNTHCHVFKAHRPYYARYDMNVKELEIGDFDAHLFEVKHLDETETKLCDYFKTPEYMIEYVYDFGDTWDHEIVLEKMLPSVAGKEYPVCVTGKRAHPPEHCLEEDDNDSWETGVFNPESVKFSRFSFAKEK